MQKPTKYILSFISILVIILACTKDVGLYTEVEFELTETHEVDGFINSSLITSLSVTPEEIVEGYSYSYSYKINSGEGYYIDEDNIAIGEGDKVGFSPLSTAITYIPTAIGDHSVVFTAEDNFGFTEQIIITYAITNIPVTWTAVGPEGPVLLNSSQNITVTLGNEAEETEVTYERYYSITQGNGDLYSSPFGNAETLNEWVEITPDSYELEYVPNEIGINTLEFLLQDSNRQEFTATVSFEVVAELASDKDITSFSINNVVGIITDTTINLVLAEGTDLTSLTPEIIHSGVNISPDSGVAQDFTNPVTYTVTAEDETTQIYTVIVTAPELSETKDITSFSIEGVNGVISGTDITVTLPQGTDLTSLTPEIIHSGISISPDSGVAQDFTNPVTYTVTAENDDIQEYIVTVELEEENKAPIAVATSDVTSGTPTLEVQFTGDTSSDPDGDAITYAWDFGDGNTSTEINPIHSYTTEGTYTASLIVTDNQTPALSSTEVTIEITVTEENKAPTAVATSDVTSGNSTLEVQFDGSGSSDPDGDTITYAWDFGDGNTSTEINPTHSYTTAATYTVSLIVTDDQTPALSSTEATIEITVTEENQAPTAVATSDVTSGNSTLEVQFTGDTSSDPDGDAITYAWDFGDGNTSTEINPTHSYSTIGDYTVTLTVDDGNGATASDIFDISVATPITFNSSTGEYTAPAGSNVTLFMYSAGTGGKGTARVSVDGSYLLLNSWNTLDTGENFYETAESSFTMPETGSVIISGTHFDSSDSNSESYVTISNDEGSSKYFSMVN